MPALLASKKRIVEPSTDRYCNLRLKLITEHLIFYNLTKINLCEEEAKIFRHEAIIGSISMGSSSSRTIATSRRRTTPNLKTHKRVC